MEPEHWAKVLLLNDSCDLIDGFQLRHCPLAIKIGVGRFVDPQCDIPAFIDIHVVHRVLVATEMYGVRPVFVGHGERAIDVVDITLRIATGVVDRDLPQSGSR